MIVIWMCVLIFLFEIAAMAIGGIIATAMLLISDLHSIKAEHNVVAEAERILQETRQ